MFFYVLISLACQPTHFHVFVFAGDKRHENVRICEIFQIFKVVLQKIGILIIYSFIDLKLSLKIVLS